MTKCNHSRVRGVGDRCKKNGQHEKVQCVKCHKIMKNTKRFQRGEDHRAVLTIKRDDEVKKICKAIAVLKESFEQLERLQTGLNDVDEDVMKLFGIDSINKIDAASLLLRIEVLGQPKPKIRVKCATEAAEEIQRRKDIEESRIAKILYLYGERGKSVSEIARDERITRAEVSTIVEKAGIVRCDKKKAEKTINQETCPHFNRGKRTDGKYECLNCGKIL